MKQSDLETGVKMVLKLGLSTGHADTWLQLLDEVLDQYQECSSKLDEYKQLVEVVGTTLDDFARKIS